MLDRGRYNTPGLEVGNGDFLSSPIAVTTVCEGRILFAISLMLWWVFWNMSGIVVFALKCCDVCGS